MTRLHAQDVSVDYAGRTALRDANLTVRAGDIVGVTGPSGCGKTTLLRVLAGLQRPCSGTVQIGGSVGMLAQHPRLVCNPRWQLGAVIAEPARIRRSTVDLDPVITRVGLDPLLLDRYPAQVSDGQLQRACIARALMAQPTFLLCDEPTAMLDPIASAAVVDLLRQMADEGTGVVVVTHDPRIVAGLTGDVLELGDR
ncbi:ABC transporter [Mycobacterium sp. MS1601]|uniref:ABC transporter ATP-binding protein n=1 Tax=Mycobacterium sp. MS1601 TaxID=1936029 RepID=UPI00097941C4|nr:ATP-binding cassette domain-containing protein [Mycobacterium sp. MS1601]AQA05949.1 ABC transporter [Mycobacterium sp. MS1601]